MSVEVFAYGHFGQMAFLVFEKGVLWDLAEGGEDEWWANFFGEHSAGNTVATPVAVILESIVEKLHRTASK